MKSGIRLSAVFAACALSGTGMLADTTPLKILDPTLQVTTVLNSGITQPIGIVFLAENDFLVLEKASGQVKRVINGALQATPVLDLAVNSASERGLLSMALDPNFPATPHVYIRWTQSGPNFARPVRRRSMPAVSWRSVVRSCRRRQALSALSRAPTSAFSITCRARGRLMASSSTPVGSTIWC
jgi:glucose/arabinose dehydrogenase